MPGFHRVTQHVAHGVTTFGISMTPLGWIAERIAARPELSLVALMESAWDKHQDAVAVARR